MHLTKSPTPGRYLQARLEHCRRVVKTEGMFPMCDRMEGAFGCRWSIATLVIVSIGCLSGSVVAEARRGSESPSGRLVLDLSGRRWQMEGIRPGQGVREGFHEHFGEVCPSTFNWNGATVPGDVYTDLWRAGEIDDPHYGRNGLRAKWAMEKEWWYRRHFAAPASWKGKSVRVIFEGVDYACDVWMNGKHLGRHEGMFSPFEFDVTPLLQHVVGL